MAHAPNAESHGLGRSRDEGGSSQAAVQPPHGHHQIGEAGFIKYLPRAETFPLTLIQGGRETFGDVLSLLQEYEGVLERSESFAANLGAKLTGPRLLKGIDKLFDGPIRTSPQQSFLNPITWLDVAIFAKSNPNEFVLSNLPDGTRSCQFSYKGLQVEISEDDWRLISSGALDRLPWDHPLEEDEMAELATLEILEQRISTLYKKADEVARRARILHHNVGFRKQDINRRRKTQESSGWRQQPPSNQPQRPLNTQPSDELQFELLQQFMAASTASQSRSTSGAGLPITPLGQQSPSLGFAQGARPQTQHSRSHGGSATASAEGSTYGVARSPIDTFRTLVTQKTDKLHKGDPIEPPCDRCRRLRCPCVKHLTACQGCTKKHAKCSWRSVTEEEVARLRQEMGSLGPEDQDMDRDSASTTTTQGELRINHSGAFSGSATPSAILAADRSRPQSQAGDAGTPGPGGSRATPNREYELAPIKGLSQPQEYGMGMGRIAMITSPPPLERRSSQYGDPSNPPSR